MTADRRSLPLRRRTGAHSRPAHRNQETTQAGAISVGGETLQLKVIRSVRRKKTVSARLLNWDTLEIRAPADLRRTELDPIIRHLAERTLRQRAKQRDFVSDEGLETRARSLNRKYFDGTLRWRSIRFVDNQNSRFGSCSPGRGTIRISRRLASTPPFVIDYVLVHELAHLIEGNHSPAFWKLVRRYPKTERALGYLMALQLESDHVDEDHESSDSLEGRNVDTGGAT